MHDTYGREPRVGLRRARKLDGAAFAFEQPQNVPSIWGRDGEAAWVPGESFMCTGPEGVGKTTLLLQLLRGRCGLLAELLSLPVQPAKGVVVLLAMDRPAQVARSFRRQVDEGEAEILRARLAVWKGPLPVNVLERPTVFADWIEDEFPGASDVFIDSIKDVVPKVSDDEAGNRYNLARQELLVRGLQVVESHHQRKEQRGQGAPKTLADTHGSRWLTAGAGSVLLLWGEPGDHVVELVHLKQPAEPFGPHKVIHDHVRGTSALYEPADLHASLERAAGGLLVADAARVMFETADPSANQIEKARRKLNRLVERGDAFRGDDADGSARYFAGVSRVTPRVTPLTNASRRSRDGSTMRHEGVTDTLGHLPPTAPPSLEGGVRENVTSEEEEIERLARVARQMEVAS